MMKFKAQAKKPVCSGHWAKLAVGSNRQWGVASGASKAAAEQAAVTNCTCKGRRNCAIPADLPGQCM